MSLLGRFQLF